LKIHGKKIFHVEYHNLRLNKARAKIFGIDDEIDLQHYIQLPGNLNEDMYKCRVLYGKEMGNVEFAPYQVKNIQTLKLVEANNINYKFKYNNRDGLNYLLTLKEQCDDIIIIKNGNITDSSSGNLVFFDGREWVTPSTPLLAGTCRQRLIDAKIIMGSEIKVSDIQEFKEVKIINAMRGMELDGVPINNIYF